MEDGLSGGGVDSRLQYVGMYLRVRRSDHQIGRFLYFCFACHTVCMVHVQRTYLLTYEAEV
jgi:hypothetical protein